MKKAAPGSPGAAFFCICFEGQPRRVRSAFQPPQTTIAAITALTASPIRNGAIQCAQRSGALVPITAAGHASPGRYSSADTPMPHSAVETIPRASPFSTASPASHAMPT